MVWMKSNLNPQSFITGPWLWCVVCSECNYNYWVHFSFQNINSERVVLIFRRHFWTPAPLRGRLCTFISNTKQELISPTILCVACTVFFVKIKRMKLWPPRSLDLNPCDRRLIVGLIKGRRGESQPCTEIFTKYSRHLHQQYVNMQLTL